MEVRLMKMIPTILLVLLAGTMLTGCDEEVVVSNPEPSTQIDPVAVLEDQVTSERELREKAETRAEEEANRKGTWQLTALGLAVITVTAFFGGTAIGSRGRRHADSTS